MTSRRQFLSVASAGAAFALMPKLSFASADTDRRFIFVIQRGAADGLHLVAPYGDANYKSMRGALAIDPAVPNQNGNTAFKLDGMFALHPSFVDTAAMYGAGEVLVLHAIGSPYKDRSHFDGQNVIETGGTSPYQLKDGWLNRLAAMLPKSRSAPIAFAPTLPMALRGKADVTSYAPSALHNPNADLFARISAMYQNDDQLHGLWTAALATQDMAKDASAGQDARGIGKLAASFLARPDGPRIAMIETNGWDTHNQQEARLSRLLTGFDGMMTALKTGMGDAWAQTTVLVATEFGRTVAVNGTGGTDHGTASSAMLLGGAVKGGRVLADWPGLAQASLFEGRDLRATLELDSLIAAAVSETFGLDPDRVAKELFPGVPRNKRMQGLIKTA